MPSQTPFWGQPHRDALLNTHINNIVILLRRNKGRAGRAALTNCQRCLLAVFSCLTVNFLPPLRSTRNDNHYVIVVSRIDIRDANQYLRFT